MGILFEEKTQLVGLEEVQFQSKLLTVCLLNALCNYNEWQISTENRMAGRFDDIVIEQSDGSAILIQVIHKENKILTKNLLLSHNSQMDEFSLPRCFFSYERIKRNFKVKAVIICTNTDINQKGLENMVNSQCAGPDHMLHYKGSHCSFITCKENILPELKVNAEIFCSRNLKGKGIDKAAVTDENMRDFLQHLQIFTNYPSGNKLDNVIKQLLTNLKYSKHSKLYCNIFLQQLVKKVEDWFKQPTCEYLTEIRTRAMFSEIKNEKYCEFLKNCNVSFEYNDFNFKDSESIFHVAVEEGHLMQMLKIYHALHGYQGKKLFVNPEEDVQVQKCIIEVFELPRYTHLIMAWSSIIYKNLKREISNRLRDILGKYPYKKVILVAKASDELIREITFKDILQFNGSVKFETLSKNSQEKLLNGKHVNFQGRIISMKELLDTQTVEDYKEFLNLEMLENVFRGKKIDVGVRYSDLKEEMIPYYIPRRFKGNVYKWLREENIFDMNEKLILIKGCAGMGKSTTLTKLAMTIKTSRPYLWVIKITLTDYTSILRDLKNKTAFSLIEMLDSHEATKFTNHFEKFVFSMKAKVVLMLDGLEEINTDYMDLVLDLISQCQQASNFKKIFVTTRPCLSKKLEANLKGTLFEMLPFTEQDQIHFLANNWAHDLELNEYKMQYQCQQHAKILIDKINFSATPLHLRMLADIFQKNVRWKEYADQRGSKEYLDEIEKELNLPEKCDITKLFTMFIKQKRDLLRDKEDRNMAADETLINQFEECLNCHRTLALEIVLGKQNSDLFSNFHQSNKDIDNYVIKMEIVQKSGNKFQFVHQTLAEYFVADSIVRELQFGNKNVGFQRLLIDEILLNSAFTVTRAFLNGILEVEKPLPSNIFRLYMKSSTIKERNHYLIHLLAKEGLVAILQLVLKCTNFRRVASKLFYLKNFVVDYSTRNMNTLNAIRYRTLKNGINFRNKSGKTPMNYAVQEGHLDMVKFLINNGADVDETDKDRYTVLNSESDVYLGEPGKHERVETSENIVKQGHIEINVTDRFPVDIPEANKRLHVGKYSGAYGEFDECLNKRDNKDLTQLHLAVKNGNLDTVKLMCNNVDVNITDSRGHTALHLAVLYGRLDIIQYLIASDFDVNIKDSDGRTLLHLAANYGKLDTVKFLVKHEVGINVKDNNGSTPLHLAARRGTLDIVIYLVEQNADVNNKDDDDCTPLHVAAAYGQFTVVNYLSRLVSDINLKDSYSYQALQKTVDSGDLNTVEYLAEVQEMSDKDWKDHTPLNITTRWQKPDIVKHLVKSSSDINIKHGDEDTVLHKAVEKGDMDTVGCLVKLGVDVNSRGYKGTIPLHLAACRGKLDVLNDLVILGSNLDIMDNDGRSALHWAAEGGKAVNVNFLVKCGINVNVRDNEGDSPLHLAVKTGQLDTVKSLMRCGADINFRNNAGRTPLHLAAEKGELKIVRVFEKCGVNLNISDNEGYTAQDLAEKKNELDTSNFLVEQRKDFNVNSSYTVTFSTENTVDTRDEDVNTGSRLTVDVNNEENITALHTAVLEGQLDIIKSLVARGVDLTIKTDEGRTALHSAASRGQLDVVEFLVDNHVEIDIKDENGNTALHLADDEDHFDTVKFLVRSGADINITDDDDNTILHCATECDRLATVEYLVKDVNADVNAKGNGGRTPLHIAVKWGNIDIAKFLVDREDIKINIEDDNGHTPLHLAAEWHRLDTVKLLVEKKGDVNVKDNEGCTAAHLAVRWGNLDTVIYLAKNGADINMKDRYDRTVLHLVAEEGEFDVVKSLVEIGAIVNITDSDYCTALDLAKSNGHIDIVNYLSTIK